MILDASALVAIVKDEAEKVPFLTLMRDAGPLRMGAPSVLELLLVLGPARVDHAHSLLNEGGVEVVAFNREHMLVAQCAHSRFGRGSGSPARLDFGDCMSYAVAKVAGEPLLFKGENFTHTDIESAWTPGA